MNSFLRQALGYGVASLGALLVDMTLLWVLVDRFSWRALSAATASFLAGATVAYVLSLKLAFTQHRLHDRRAEFIGFVAIGGAGLAVNAAVITLAMKYLGLHLLPAKAVAAGCTCLCNFIARRQLLFVRHVH